MITLRALTVTAVLLLSVFACDSYAATDMKTGVVLLHGKWGNSSLHINHLATAMRERGYIVLTPLMPWSKEREYDGDYAAALEIIDRNIKELRQNGGATTIILAGHSMGANAAIAYAAHGQEKIDGVVAIAPGHTPDRNNYQQAIASSLNKAREMISAGKGSEQALFVDLNGGRKANINMTAATYYSYNSPDGMASMPINAAKVNQRIPLFWILAGESDVLYTAGKEYVFAKWPPHPLNTYLLLHTTHLNAPDTAKDAILEWIDTLGHNPKQTNSLQ